MNLYKTPLKKNFSIPLYYQLKEILSQEIKNGSYDENTPLPPETEMASKFNISRPTVRQAICSLVNDGVLTRTKGKGTFVIPPEIKEETIRHLNNYNEEINPNADFPKTELISCEKVAAAPEICHHLKITADSEVFELIRLRYINDEPNSLITSYIPAESCPMLPTRDFNRESLYHALECAGIYIQKVKRIFAVEMPSLKDRAILKIPENVPIFLFTTTASSTDKIPVEYSLTKYRGDKNKFSIELKK